MKVNKALIWLTVLLLLVFNILTGCLGPSRDVTRGFYYWKSGFELNQADLTELKVLKIGRLYLKFFDVVWDQGYGGPIPVSIIDIKSKPPGGIEIVPVVFITVEALERLSTGGDQELALKIAQKIEAILRANQFKPVTEIQLDCDWNATTRLKYFTVLARLRKLMAAQKIRISATIRLHQVKYASTTGVPPVDRGMLMFYNFDSPKRPEVKNSILDLTVGREYTSELKHYPLPIDLALPLFSWGALFHGDHFQGLINNLRGTDLRNDSRFRATAPDCFTALVDCRFHNIQIYKSDWIRVEESRYREIMASTRYLAGKIHYPRLNVAFFHFDHSLIEGVGGREKISRLFDSLR